VQVEVAAVHDVVREVAFVVHVIQTVHALVAE